MSSTCKFDEQPVASKVSPDAVVEVLVRRLNGICRKVTLEFALTVGKTVIDDIYGGDICAWRSRDPTKEISVRKLVRHPLLPMSPGALYRSIAIYELCERIDVHAWKHISSSHLRLVLPLPEPEQVRLLHLAEANKWSVRRLDEEVGAMPRSTATLRGGPKRRSIMRLAARRAVKALERLAECLEPAGSLDEASPDSVREAIACVRLAASVGERIAGRSEGHTFDIDDSCGHASGVILSRPSIEAASPSCHHARETDAPSDLSDETPNPDDGFAKGVECGSLSEASGG
jgi:hypothetical protein